MLETGGILIVMGAIFAVGAAGEWILSLFYRRYLRDTADMGRPGKKLVKLTKLRYETSYYLNGTVHNAKSMVDGMLEHYRLAGLRLWTWHHIATLAAFLCGATGFAIGGAYVVGRYVPAVKEMLPLSGMNALIYTLAGVALAAMLIFWQNLLDNRAKRRRLESNLVDYFDNEKFHQLGREIALSGRVREIAGDRGRREDPGSMTAGAPDGMRVAAGAVEAGVSGDLYAAATGSMATGTPDGMRMAATGTPDGMRMAATGIPDGMRMTAAGTPAGMSGEDENSVSGTAGRGAADGSSESILNKKSGKTAAAAKAPGKKSSATGKTAGKAAGKMELPAAEETDGQEKSYESYEAAVTAGATGGMTIGDIISSSEAFGTTESEAGEGVAVRGRGTSARRKTAAASSRARAKNVQIAQEEMEERRTGSSRRKEKAAKDVIIPLNPENGASEGREKADEPEKQAESEAAATVAGAAAPGVGPSGDSYADAKAAREEELLRLLREYMGL